MNLTAVVLAGGQSSRMGRDKAFLPFEGQTLLDHQIATLRASGAGEILISGRPDSNYADFGLTVVLDETPGQGPLGGWIAAARRASGGRLLVLAVDLPFMTGKFLRRLVGESGPVTQGCVPSREGRLEPLVAVYPRDCLPIAERLLAEGRRAMREFVNAAVFEKRVHLLPVGEAEAHLFRNWNTSGGYSA